MRRSFALKRDFLLQDHGGLSIEALIMFPILLWAFGGMFVFFDAFKTNTTNVKATYTVADLISRMTEPIDEEFIDGMNRVYAFLTGGDSNNDIRVTVVRREVDADNNESNALVWSYASGTMLPYTELGQVANIIPMMAVGAETIIVQTRTDWVPPVGYGLTPLTLTDLAFTSPRFAPQVVWGGDGTGSGTSNTAVHDDHTAGGLDDPEGGT